MSLPIIAALTRMTAQWPHAPRIVTVSRRPAGGLLGHFYGTDRAFNLILNEDGGATLTGADSDAAVEPFVDLAHAANAILAADGVILRFIDTRTIAIVKRDCPDLIDRCRAVWLQLVDPGQQSAACDTFHQRGFAHRLSSHQPPGELFARDTVRFDPAPDHSTVGRAAMNTLVLIDNNLSGERGHYLSVASRIALGAQQAGVQMIWAVDERLSAALVPRNVELAPVFRASIFDIPREQQASVDLSADIATGLRAIFSSFDSPTTHFLFPTTDAHHIRALHALVADGWRASGTIHLSTPYETRHMPSRHAGREVDWYLRDLLDDPRVDILLWAETDVLAGLMEARLEVKVPALPLPAPPWGAEMPPAPTQGPLTIAFLGEARLDKGFLELPGIADAILRAGRSPGDLRITIQATPPHGGFSAEMDDAVASLRGMDGVDLLTDVLTDDQYRGVIRDAHCILLPYRVDNYAYRGSGILFEALASGRLVLATAHTIAESYAHDGQVLLAGSSQEWTDNVALVLADRARFARDASRVGKRFARRHAPRAYIDRLAFRAEFAALSLS